MNAARLNETLAPYRLNLTPEQARVTLEYLDLLMRWNQKINLTAIRSEDEAVTRHFGESLYLSKHLELAGTLLDIGSGAGFPGLALKIAFPELDVMLLEPVAKKRAFLKEVVRVCGFASVKVSGERLEERSAASPPLQFDYCTMRAVGNLDILVPLAAKALKMDGKCLLWLSSEQGVNLSTIETGLAWQAPIMMPISGTEIWRGDKLK